MDIIKTTIVGQDIPDRLFQNYIGSLVNQFFKILPIRENEEPTLREYMKNLQIELLGSKGLIAELNNDSQYLTLISILQYMIDNDCDIPTTKSQVFKAISICNRLKGKYCMNEE